MKTAARAGVFHPQAFAVANRNLRHGVARAHRPLGAADFDTLLFWTSAERRALHATDCRDLYEVAKQRYPLVPLPHGG